MIAAANRHRRTCYRGAMGRGLVLLVASAALLGCGAGTSPIPPRQSPAPAHPAATTTPAASASSGRATDEHGPAAPAVVDESYRFRITLPGPKWRLLGEVEAGTLVVPGAIAGAIAADGTQGAIFVEPIPTQTLDQFATLIAGKYDGDQVEKHEGVAFGQPAIRLEVTSRESGSRQQLVNTLFFNHGFAYQVVSWHRGFSHSSEIEAFQRAFSILDGKVTPRPSRAPAVSDTRGIGWRIRGGVFESAVSGLRIAPASGWHLSVGGDLRTMSDRDEVGLIREAPDAYLVLRSQVATSARERQRLRAMWALENVKATGATYTANLAGEDLALTAYHAPRSSSKLIYLVGFHVHDDRLIGVKAWFVPREDHLVLSSLREALSAITFLPEPDRRALARNLAAAQAPFGTIGAAYSLITGRYRDFADGVMWVAPRGFWRIEPNDLARLPNGAAVVHLSLAGQGITGEIYVDRNIDTTPRAYHKQFEAAIVEHASGLAPRSVSGHPGFYSRGTRRIGHTTVHYRLVSAVRGGTGVQIALWGTRDAVSRNRATISAALRALAWFPGNYRDSVLGIYVSARLGYALIPPAGWVESHDPRRSKRAVGGITRWTQGDSALRVVVSRIDPEKSEDAVAATIIALLKARFGAGQILEHKATLGGLPATRVTIPAGLLASVETYVAVHHRVLYMVIASASDQRVFAGAIASFTFLDFRDD